MTNYNQAAQMAAAPWMERAARRIANAGQRLPDTTIATIIAAEFHAHSTASSSDGELQKVLANVKQLVLLNQKQTACDVIDRALAARAALSAAAPQQWQSIETAPKDGTQVLLGRKQPWSSSSNVCVAFWADERQTDFPEWRTDRGFKVDTRIYCLWATLPAPPVEEGNIDDR